MRLSQVAVNGLELTGVGLPEVLGHLHASQHNASVRVLSPGALDDHLQVGAGGLQRQPSQTVVAAQLQQEGIHRSTQDPIQTTETAR